MKRLAYVEPFALLFIAYFGWGIGERNRLTFSELSFVDQCDLAITLLSTFISFFGLKYLLKFALSRDVEKIGKITRIALAWFVVYLSNILFIGLCYVAFFNHFWDNNLIYHTTPIFIAFSIFIVPYLYITLTSNTVQEVSPDSRIEIHTLSGKGILKLTDVYYFLSEGKQTYACTGNQKHPIAHTLKELEELLPSSDFFRANRQFIISQNKVKGYNNSSFQKLEVVWKDSESLPLVIVSKYNAAAFKTWLNSQLISG